ncbi:MAG: hypothetical protein GX883_04990 [Firmicutes bacterium]|nr:hypothetical protein [Bacillota bacterium]
MDDTAERVRRVRLRAGELHRKRENRLLGGLSSLCAVLTFSLIGAIAAMTGGRQGGTVPGFYGAMLLYDGVGGYVLVGVLALAAGVVVTALCLRYRRKTEKQKDERDKEDITQ